MTVQAWVKPEGAQLTRARIVSRYNSHLDISNYLLTYDISGRYVRFLVDTDGGRYETITTTQIVDPNKWYNIVGVWTGSRLEIYVDGVLQKNTATTGTTARLPSDKIMRIGRDTATIRCFVGNIDEVAIWNKALSAAEIADLYQTTQQ